MKKDNQVVVWGLSYKSRKDMKPVNWRSGVSFGTNIIDLETITALVKSGLNSEGIQDITTKELWDDKYVFLNGSNEIAEATIGRESSFVQIYSEKENTDEIKGNLQKKVSRFYDSYSEDLPDQYRLTIPPSKSKTKK